MIQGPFLPIMTVLQLSLLESGSMWFVIMISSSTGTQELLMTSAHHAAA